MSDPSQIHRVQIQVRFGDTDALGHVNNASFAAYAEIARLEFLTLFGKSVRSLILASLYIDFRRQVKFDESVHVETRVGRIGTSSITLEQTVFAGDERAADIKSTVVYFDYAAGKSRQLTADMRDSLAPYVVRAVSPLSSRPRVLAVVGSLQARSSNGSIVGALAPMLGSGVEVIVTRALHELPPFNSDFESENVPDAVTAWRGELAAAAAVVFATPEYAFGIAGRSEERARLGRWFGRAGWQAGISHRRVDDADGRELRTRSVGPNASSDVGRGASDR